VNHSCPVNKGLALQPLNLPGQVEVGILRPLKMLPIVLFEIIYKLTWLAIVAYPLWVKNELIGSPAEGMTRVFLWVGLPILAMPWRYFFMTYILGKRRRGR